MHILSVYRVCYRFSDSFCQPNNWYLHEYPTVLKMSNTDNMHSLRLQTKVIAYSTELFRTSVELSKSVFKISFGKSERRSLMRLTMSIENERKRI